MINDSKLSLFARIKQMNEKYTWILAGGYSAGVVALLIAFHIYPSAQDSALTGRLIDGEMLILYYYFGSSLGSRNKDNLLAEKKEEDKKS